MSIIGRLFKQLRTDVTAADSLHLQFAMDEDELEEDGKLKIVGKDEVKEAIGRSPDTGDTFIMRMKFELERDAVGGTYEQSVSAINRRVVRRGIPQRGF